MMQQPNGSNLITSQLYKTQDCGDIDALAVSIWIDIGECPDYE
jgi:hypothetical protein